MVHSGAFVGHRLPQWKCVYTHILNEHANSNQVRTHGVGLKYEEVLKGYGKRALIKKSAGERGRHGGGGTEEERKTGELKE